MPRTAIKTVPLREYFYLHAVALSFLKCIKCIRITMSRKVVIVDDERDLCLLLKSFLLQQGFLVFTSHSLSEGLRVIAETLPDILILDNNLPDGSGWDSLTLIRGQFPSTKVILISAFNARATDVSANVSIIEKPVSLITLQTFLA